MWQKVGRFLASEEGPTAVEYAVMLAMILMAVFATVVLLGENTSESYTDSAAKIEKAMTSK